jgi:hypothetical protein
VAALLGRRGPGRRPAPAFRREMLAGIVRLHATLAVAAGGWPGVARALAGGVAEATVGSTLGEAALVAGEPPIVAAFAGRRDVVAPRVFAALTAGEAHRRPVLWLRLAPGAYLAEALDPEVPFAAGPAEVAAMVRGGRATAALLAAAAPHGGDVALRLELYAPPAAARELLRLARRHLPPMRPLASQR